MNKLELVTAPNIQVAPSSLILGNLRLVWDAVKLSEDKIHSTTTNYRMKTIRLAIQNRNRWLIQFDMISFILRLYLIEKSLKFQG